MNVCIFTTAYKFGGTEKSTIRLATLLNDSNIKVTILSPKTFQEEIIKEENLVQFSYGVKKRGLVHMLISGLKVRKFFIKQNFDIIHCQDAYAVIIAILARLLLRNNLKIIWHVRGVKERTYFIMTKLSNKIDYVIANSHDQRTKLVVHGYDPEKIRVIYNGFEEAKPKKTLSNIREEFNLNTEDYIVSTVGRFTYDKGMKYLLEAYEYIAREIPNLKMLLIGDGVCMKDFREFVDKKNINQNVIFTGYRSDVYDLLSASNVFVFPSLWEAFGNVGIEAMKVGIPVVASRVGGIPEYVEHMTTGILVESGNSREIAQSIITLSRNNELKDKIVNNASAMVKSKFGFDRLRQELIDYYTFINKVQS